MTGSTGDVFERVVELTAGEMQVSLFQDERIRRVVRDFAYVSA